MYAHLGEVLYISNCRGWDDEDLPRQARDKFQRKGKKRRRWPLGAWLATIVRRTEPQREQAPERDDAEQVRRA